MEELLLLKRHSGHVQELQLQEDTLEKIGQQEKDIMDIVVMVEVMVDLVDILQEVGIMIMGQGQLDLTEIITIMAIVTRLIIVEVLHITVDVTVVHPHVQDPHIVLVGHLPLQLLDVHHKQIIHLKFII